MNDNFILNFPFNEIQQVGTSEIQENTKVAEMFTIKFSLK